MNGMSSSSGPSDIGPLNPSMFATLEVLQEAIQQREQEILGSIDPEVEELVLEELFPVPEGAVADQDVEAVPAIADDVETVPAGTLGTKADSNGLNHEPDNVASPKLSDEQEIDSSDGEENVISEDDLPESEQSNDKSTKLKFQADEKVKRGEWRDAIDLYTKALQIQQTAPLYGNRSLCYMKIEEFKKAERDCSCAIELDPYYKRIYRRRAAIRLRNRDYHGSAEDLQTLQILNFSSPLDPVVCEEYKVLLPLARWIKTHGNEPTEEFKRLEKDVLKNLSRIEQSAAKMYKSKQLWAQAVESWSMAMIVSPPSGWLFAERGLANFKLGKADLGETDVTEALRLEPSNPSHYRLRAEIRKKLGNFKGSAADLAKSKELGPSTATVDLVASTSDALVASTSDALVASTTVASSVPLRRLIEELPEPTRPTPTFRTPVRDVYSSSADELYDFRRLPESIRSLLFRP